MRTSAVYCASKAALEMAVRVASREYAPKGWRINAVAPGKVADTPMTGYVDDRVLTLRGWSAEFAEKYELASTPLGRKITKAEVAGVIEQVLFGPAAQTGEIVAVNGGR
jgi:NAD(P)-dependent dehydrogenase (short-subunit alcohol dehydrogenase family)